MSTNRAVLLYRFRSSTESKSIKIPGSSIRGREAREMIAEALGLGDLDIALMIGDKEVEPTQLIEAFSEVIVERRLNSKPGKPPSAFVKEKMKEASRVKEVIGLAKESPFQSGSNFSAGGGAPGGGFRAGAGGGDDELAKIMELKSDVGAQQGSMRLQNDRGGGRFNQMRDVDKQPPPPDYVCFNCKKRGHWINDCPEPKNFLGRLQHPVGIPESKLERVDPALLETATPEEARHFLITRNGIIVRRKVDKHAMGEVEGVATHTATWNSEADGDIPNHWKCPVCQQLLKEAVKPSCCDAVFCNHCTDTIVSNAPDDDCPRCPGCKEPLDIEEIKPAEEIRAEIESFRKTRKRPRQEEQ